MAKFFVGQDTLVCDAHGIKTQNQLINTLCDNIRFRGAMTTLITDGGRYEISKIVADILRSLFIKQHESEPYHQHQNKAEQRYDVVMRYNLSKSSRIPTRSHQDLEVPFHNMITSRSTSSQGILFSTSPGEMSLLH